MLRHRIFYDSETRSSHTSKRLILGIGIMIGVTLTSRLYGGLSVGDDTFIYMRYVANALDGFGFTYNPGEISFGVTSPAWTLLMTGIATVAGNNLQTWRGASSLLLGLSALVLFFHCSARVRPPLAALLAITAVLEPHTFRWSSSGMENSLCVLGLTVTALMFVRFGDRPTSENWPNSAALGMLTGLMPILRPELAVFSTGIVICLLTNHAQVASRRIFFGTAIAAVGCSIILTYTLFGSFLPQTAVAKAIALHQVDLRYGLSQAIKIIVSGSVGVLLLVAIGRTFNKYLAYWRVVTCVGVIAFALYLGLRNHLVSTRYASTLAFPCVLLGVLLLADAAANGTLRRWQLILVGLHLSLSGALLAYTFPATRTAEHVAIASLAESLRPSADAGACRVALTEVGAFGFYSGCYVIDLVGLTDKQTLRWMLENREQATGARIADILRQRAATHFVHSFLRTGDPTVLIQGFHLELLNEMPVVRNNMSRGTPTADLWRLYAVSPVHYVASTQ
jgi:hypothetical protein